MASITEKTKKLTIIKNDNINYYRNIKKTLEKNEVSENTKNELNLVYDASKKELLYTIITLKTELIALKNERDMMMIQLYANNGRRF